MLFPRVNSQPLCSILYALYAVIDVTCSLGQVSIVPEPVDTWQNLEGGGNILDAFYKDPKRYAYTFQNYVFLTRCMQVTTAWVNSAVWLCVPRLANTCHCHNQIYK